MHPKRCGLSEDFGTHEKFVYTEIYIYNSLKEWLDSANILLKKRERKLNSFQQNVHFILFGS